VGPSRSQPFFFLFYVSPKFFSATTQLSVFPTLSISPPAPYSARFLLFLRPKDVFLDIPREGTWTAVLRFIFFFLAEGAPSPPPLVQVHGIKSWTFVPHRSDSPRLHSLLVRRRLTTRRSRFFGYFPSFLENPWQILSPICFFPTTVFFEMPPDLFSSALPPIFYFLELLFYFFPTSR